MSWKIILVSCLMVAVVPGTGNALRLFSWLPSYQGFLGGQNVLNNGTTGMLSGAKQAVNAIAGVKSHMLSSAVNATKQALDVGARMAAPIPVVGTAVGLGTNVMKAGADAVNSVGQGKISFFQNLKNAKLTMLERMFGGSGSTTARPTTTTSRPTTSMTIATAPATVATTSRPLTTSNSATTTTLGTTSTPATTIATTTPVPTTTAASTTTASTTTASITTASTTTLSTTTASTTTASTTTASTTTASTTTASTTTASTTTPSATTSSTTTSIPATAASSTTLAPVVTTNSTTAATSSA